jgi:hypothetical protein
VFFWPAGMLKMVERTAELFEMVEEWWKSELHSAMSTKKACRNWMLQQALR